MFRNLEAIFIKEKAGALKQILVLLNHEPIRFFVRKEKIFKTGTVIKIILVSIEEKNFNREF